MSKRIMFKTKELEDGYALIRYDLPNNEVILEECHRIGARPSGKFKFLTINEFYEGFVFVCMPLPEPTELP